MILQSYHLDLVDKLINKGKLEISNAKDDSFWFRVSKGVAASNTLVTRAEAIEIFNRVLTALKPESEVFDADLEDLTPDGE